MNLPPILKERRKLLIAELSAIDVLQTIVSKEASKSVRDVSKLLDNTSVQLRRELVEFDKSLSC